MFGVARRVVENPRWRAAGVNKRANGAIGGDKGMGSDLFPFQGDMQAIFSSQISRTCQLIPNPYPYLPCWIDMIFSIDSIRSYVAIGAYGWNRYQRREEKI
jgi:hypothetical protein